MFWNHVLLSSKPCLKMCDHVFDSCCCICRIYQSCAVQTLTSHLRTDRTRLKHDAALMHGHAGTAQLTLLNSYNTMRIHLSCNTSYIVLCCYLLRFLCFQVFRVLKPAGFICRHMSSSQMLKKLLRMLQMPSKMRPTGPAAQGHTWHGPLGRTQSPPTQRILQNGAKTTPRPPNPPGKQPATQGRAQRAHGSQLKGRQGRQLMRQRASPGKLLMM